MNSSVTVQKVAVGANPLTPRSRMAYAARVAAWPAGAALRDGGESAAVIAANSRSCSADDPVDDAAWSSVSTHGTYETPR